MELNLCPTRLRDVSPLNILTDGLPCISKDYVNFGR